MVWMRSSFHTHRTMSAMLRNFDGVPLRSRMFHSVCDSPDFGIRQLGQSRHPNLAPSTDFALRTLHSHICEGLVNTARVLTPSTLSSRSLSVAAVVLLSTSTSKYRAMWQ